MMVRCVLRSIALNTTRERPPQVSPADLTVSLLRGENVGALVLPLAYSRFPARHLIRQVPLNPNRAAVSGCSKSTLCRPTTWSVVIRDLRELYGGTAAPRGNPSTWLRDYPLTSADGPTAGLRTYSLSLDPPLLKHDRIWRGYVHELARLHMQPVCKRKLKLAIDNPILLAVYSCHVSLHAYRGERT